VRDAGGGGRRVPGCDWRERREHERKKYDGIKLILTIKVLGGYEKGTPRWAVFGLWGRGGGDRGGEGFG